MSRRAKGIRRTLLLAGIGGVSAGWVRPQPPVPARVIDEGGARLDYMTIEVGGETKLVRAGDELVLVAGDTFTVHDAFLVNPSLRPGEVNVLGFSNGQPRSKAGEDRDHAVDTGLALKPKWSEAGAGNVYAVVAQTGDQLHGAIYVRLLEPVLRYAEISVNGQPRVMRDGEELSLKRTDKMKVERIVTNLQSESGVTFQIVERVTARGGAPADTGHYEVRFLRGGRRFAAIPLSVHD